MSELRIYSVDNAQLLKTHTKFEDIERELKAIGVGFERWEAKAVLDDDASQDEVIEAYREPIDRLMQRHGFQSVDVVVMHPDHPNKQAMREKFLHEHQHSDFEVRFFVDGSGLFNIRTEDRVYGMLCTKRDLISVPANTRHWFDMGEAPYFKAIRLFTTPEGWVAQFTGDKVADRFPRFDEVAEAA